MSTRIGIGAPLSASQEAFNRKPTPRPRARMCWDYCDEGNCMMCDKYAAMDYSIEAKKDRPELRAVRLDRFRK